jgi:hypothetical protein
LVAVLNFMGSLLALISAAPDCTEARNYYESLDLERAVEAAGAALAAGSSRPVACLEVRGLALLVLGRSEEARLMFGELFRISPDHPVRDPSLSPAMRERIEAIRAEVRPIHAELRARWLIHESLRLDVLIDGGLRGATRVQYRAATAPGGELRSGVVDLIGRTATATLAVSRGAPTDRLKVLALVVDRGGRELARSERELLLDARPPPAEAEVVVVDSGGPGWPLWLGIGAAAAAATVAIIVLAQPNRPDFSDTIGGVQVP